MLTQLQTWFVSWGWFNIKLLSYQYRESHCRDKTILRSSYLHNGISYTGKMALLYWIRALETFGFHGLPILISASIGQPCCTELYPMIWNHDMMRFCCVNWFLWFCWLPGKWLHLGIIFLSHLVLASKWCIELFASRFPDSPSSSYQHDGHRIGVRVTNHACWCG